MKLLTALLTAAALAFSGAVHAAPAPSALSEGFDDISTLSGWAVVNNSIPVGQGWFQGNPGIFPALSGAGDSYIGASYLSAGMDGYVELWLMTPVLSVTSLTQIAYSLRSADDAEYGDHVELWFGHGSGTDPNAFNAIIGHDPMSGSWESFTALAPSGASGTGRFAFRYVGSAASLDYIGIDSVSVTTPVPEPATWLMLSIGLAALLGFRHSRAAMAWGAIAISSTAFAGEPQQTGMVVVRDPQTGQLRAPTEAEHRAMTGLAASLQAGPAAPAPKTVVRPDGTVQRSMGTEGMTYSVVSRGKDGKLTIDCVTGEQAAKDAAATPKESRHEDH